MCRLIGLTWQRVSLTEGKVYVREQHQAAFGTTAPKSQRGIEPSTCRPERPHLYADRLVRIARSDAHAASSPSTSQRAQRAASRATTSIASERKVRYSR